MEQKLHLLFVDFKKAYDSIPLNQLSNILKETGINQTIIGAIQELYEDSISKIHVKKNVSQGFKCRKGLHQGFCISLSLKIYVEKALACWKK